MQPDLQLKNKKILLTAFSTAKTSESMALYNYLKVHGCGDISTLFWGGDEIAKDIPKDVSKIEINSPKDIKSLDKSKFDVVFRHTSVPPSDVADAKSVMTATQIFFEECKAPIIGVTGTKGKGTTSTLVAKILENAGKKAWLVGNVGLPALSVLSQMKQHKNSIVVYEMSSFQLWDLYKSPEAAVVLLIEPDHLDVHANFDEYVDAKKNIARFQKEDDLIAFHPTNQFSQQIADASPAKNKKRYLTPEGAYVKEDKIIIEDVAICDIEEVVLPGEHNLQNVCAAITAVWKYTQDVEAIKKAIIEFHGLEHRLKLVREVGGVKYFDDSISTTPGSAIAALKAFGPPKVIILGGSSKGADFHGLAMTIKETDIRKILLVGNEGNRIAQLLDKWQYVILGKASMADIVKAAKEYAQPGDMVILSPACASLDMFKNYRDRGDQFIAAVNQI